MEGRKGVQIIQLSETKINSKSSRNSRLYSSLHACTIDQTEKNPNLVEYHDYHLNVNQSPGGP